jgi:hypothetical protein
MQFQIISFATITLAVGLGSAIQTPTAPNIRNGQYSTVVMLEAAQSLDRSKGAQVGFRFAFLVTPRGTAKGQLALVELRDFSFDGRKFSDFSKERLGASFEPETVIDGVESFRKARPDLARLIPTTPDARSVVISTILSGATLPVNASSEVTFEVGWGESTEVFQFRFPVPSR